MVLCHPERKETSRWDVFEVEPDQRRARGARDLRGVAYKSARDPAYGSPAGFGYAQDDTCGGAFRRFRDHFPLDKKSTYRYNENGNL